PSCHSHPHTLPPPPTPHSPPRTPLFPPHTTPPTPIYTPSLTTLFRSLPVGEADLPGADPAVQLVLDPIDLLRPRPRAEQVDRIEDRESTRLNSSDVASSYAVFCLKKKNY